MDEHRERQEGANLSDDSDSLLEALERKMGLSHGSATGACRIDAYRFDDPLGMDYPPDELGAGVPAVPPRPLRPAFRKEPLPSSAEDEAAG
jgi:hypothetical protein